MVIKDVVKGHVYEVLNKNKDISSERMKICKACPLFLVNELGRVCDPNKYLNPKTGDYSFSKKDGYISGCGCRLDAKTRLLESKCPVGKW